MNPAEIEQIRSADPEAARRNNAELRAGLEAATAEIRHLRAELAYFVRVAVEKAHRDGGNCPYCGEFQGHRSDCPAAQILEIVV